MLVYLSKNIYIHLPFNKTEQKRDREKEELSNKSKSRVQWLVLSWIIEEDWFHGA